MSTDFSLFQARPNLIPGYDRESFPTLRRTEEKSTAKSTFQPVFALRGVGYQLKHICQCAKRRVAVALVVVLVEVLMEVMG